MDFFCKEFKVILKKEDDLIKIIGWGIKAAVEDENLVSQVESELVLTEEELVTLNILFSTLVTQFNSLNIE